MFSLAKIISLVHPLKKKKILWLGRGENLTVQTFFCSFLNFFKAGWFRPLPQEDGPWHINFQIKRHLYFIFCFSEDLMSNLRINFFVNILKKVFFWCGVKLNRYVTEGTKHSKLSRQTKQKICFVKLVYRHF